MSHYQFDDSNIDWQTLPGIDHLHFKVLDIDESRELSDVLFKFAANQQILLHRHKAHNNTFVIQGEHRLYHPDGSLKEVRPVGTTKSSPPDDHPHREGGGDEDVIILFSIRGTGVLYELMDDDQNVVGTLTAQDLKDLKEAA